MLDSLNNPTLVSMIMDELKQQGRDLKDYSIKAEQTASEMRGEIGKIRESQSGFAVEIHSIHTQLKDIKREVGPIAKQVAINPHTIDQLGEDKDTMFGHITKLKDSVRGTTGGSFWDGPNAKFAFTLATVLLVGLFALAGYNMNLSDVVP